MYSTILALRGSNVKPPDVTKTLEESAAASLELSTASADLHRAYKTVSELERVGNQTSNAELLKLIEGLKEKVHALEEKERKAAQGVSLANLQLSNSVRQFAAGGIAGAFARTCVAPIDRVKILMQTQYITLDGAAPKYTSVFQTLKTVHAEEGLARLWRGNFTNMLRVVPYSATQFSSYDCYKKFFLSMNDGSDQLTVPQRLGAGALAGATATTVTYPLDIARLRLAVQPELKGTRDAIMSVYKEGGIKAFSKGYIPTCVSLGPFIAINFASFDTLKNWYYPDPNEKRNPLTSGALGACAGLFAQSCCYPLDTVRRRMQMKGVVYNSTPDAFITIMKKEGPMGFYRGMLPNAMKVVPNNSLRFLAFDTLKSLFNVESTR